MINLCKEKKNSKRDVSESGSNLFGFNLTIEAMGRKRVREERERRIAVGRQCQSDTEKGGWRWVGERIAVCAVKRLTHPYSFSS